MKIVIVGAGNVGSALAEKLCQEGHDVIIIDENEEKIRAIKQKLDVLAVLGNGANPVLLKKIDVYQADVLIGVTDNDEINLLSALTAKKFEIKEKIIRVNSLDYFKEHVGFSKEDFDIDLVVNPVTLCAREINQLLHEREIFEILEGETGQVRMVGMNIAGDNPLINHRLEDFYDIKVFADIRFIAVSRNEETLIPRGDFVIQENDRLYILGNPEAITAFQDWLGLKRKPLNRVVMGDVNDLTLCLAQLLEKKGVDVRLIDDNEQRAQQASIMLTKSTVFRGNMTSESSLQEAGITNASAFLALSEDDENNILSCILASQNGADKTFSRISKIEYIPIVSNITRIHSIVSSRLTTFNSILRFLKKEEVVTSTEFHEIDAKVFEFLVDDSAKIVNTKIRDLEFPEEAIIGSVIRGDKVMVATGRLILRSGDRAIIFALPSAVDKVQKLFTKKLLKVF